MITFVPVERGWEESERFGEALAEAIARRVEEELRLRLTGDDELFAPELGQAVRRLEVRAEAGGVNIETSPPPGQEQLWERTIKDVLRENMQELPLEDARDDVRKNDPNLLLPPTDL